MKLVHFFIAAWIALTVCEPVHAKKHKAHRATPGVKVAAPAALATYVPATYGSGQLSNVLDSIIAHGTNTADIAVYVKSMRSGDALYARHVNTPMTPASTLKVLTAEAGLIFLGPNYRFSTQLLTDAKSIRNGILQGNLYIMLSGDPTLTYYDLADLLVTLKSQHHISAIAGNVYIDNTAYDQSFYGPGWIGKDKNFCYGAPISASIINHNCIPFQISSKSTGSTAQVVRSPKYFYPAIRNSVVTKGSRTRSCSLRLGTDPGSVITLDGCLSRGRFVGISYVVTDVPEYNRALFKSLLKQLSISVYGHVTFASAPSKLSNLGQHASKPLSEMIVEMLKKSDNVIAGALFKKIGQLYNHQPGTWENSSYAVSQILARNAGVNTAGMRVLDGSGLSPDNLTTPAQMMQVLDYAYHHSSSQYFISALPIAGVDGTLKHRMYNIARKVRAKTGTISGVVSLAGYAVSAQNEPLAFVIMINGSKGMGWSYKAIEDKIATALTKYNRPG